MTMAIDLERTASEQNGPSDELLGERLRRELAILCRGLVGCSWCDALRATETDINLPGDEAHELALRALCWELAEEFAIEPTVRHRDGAWLVRFALRADRTTGLAAMAGSGDSSRYRANRGVLACSADLPQRRASAAV